MYLFYDVVRNIILNLIIAVMYFIYLTTLHTPHLLLLCPHLSVQVHGVSSLRKVVRDLTLHSANLIIDGMYFYDKINISYTF